MESNVQSFSPRPASHDDLDQILEIEKKAYPLPWTREAFSEEFKKPYSHFLVLTDDETDSIIAGYTVFWIVFDECTIQNVTVNLEYRGLQFGTKIVRLVIDEAMHANCKKVLLEVRKYNDAAIKLYQKAGFFIEHIKKGFYQNGEDAYSMALFLSIDQMQ